MVGKNRIKKPVSIIILIIFFLKSFLPVTVSFAGEGAYRYGDTIRGNVISHDDKVHGNDRWSADRSVFLEEGTLWWVQDHNPMQTTLGTAYRDIPFEGAVYTSFESTEYVYYRTVGMRFTLEDISKGEENVVTLDMDGNNGVWDDPSVKFVDVFLTGIDENIKTRTSSILASGPSAGGRRFVCGETMVNRDVTNGSGVIEGHYYIENFLKRDAKQKITNDCVVGRLIELECGSDILPIGAWRIYASHIIEIMTATREKQADGRYVLRNRQERLVRDELGNLVPDVRTTLVDVLEAAGWAPVTRDEYLPALFNRYLDLTDEKLVTTTTVINYYIYGSDPVTGIVATEYPQDIAPDGSVTLSYEGASAPGHENFRLALDDSAFSDTGGGIYDVYDGLFVFSGNKTNAFAEDGKEEKNAAYRTRFLLSGTMERPCVTPLDIINGSVPSGVTVPYICIWVPLKTPEPEKPPASARKLYIRYVPANGETHIIKDFGPITIPSSTDHTYVHRPQSVITYAGKEYGPAGDMYGVQRPLLGVCTTENGKLPASYGTVISHSGYVMVQPIQETDGKISFTIPAGACDAMLFIPYEVTVVEPPDRDFNIYYIKGSKQGNYKVLATDTRTLRGSFEPVLNNEAVYSLVIRTDVTEVSTGVHWKPLDEPDSDDYAYAVISNVRKGKTLGNLRYPEARDEGEWSAAVFSRESTSDSQSIGVILSEGAYTYEIFVPCEVRTGNNPVMIYAVNASTGKMLKNEPVSTTYMSGTEALIDVSQCEEMTVGGKTYVMVGGGLEEEKVYPFATVSYAVRDMVSGTVPTMQTVSPYVVSPVCRMFDGIIGEKSTDNGLRTRNIYLNISGFGIPYGNPVAVYVPFRTASEVNVFLITDDKTDADPSGAAVIHECYHVSRSYWSEERTKQCLSEDEPGGVGGWFEFEVPGEICDADGVSYFVADGDPLAIHHDACCDGVLQRVGMCAVLCPLCKGSGRMSVRGYAAGEGVREKCTSCDGSGILVTAMNYDDLPNSDVLTKKVTEVKYCCNTCLGTGRDPAKASHSHEKKNCPECNRYGTGPTRFCPSCAGGGKVQYTDWESHTFMNGDGTYGTQTVPVIKYRECRLCAGSGDYSCGTCDGSGIVDADLCEQCHTSRFYERNGSSPGSIISYGTGYNVRSRGICEICGGKGFSLCTSCNGSGWLKAQDETGHAVPCSACGGARFFREAEWGIVDRTLVLISAAHYEYRKGDGEKRCSCTQKSYLTDPAEGDPRYSRGAWREYFDSNGDRAETRENTGFMCGGFYCAKCDTYIFSAGFPPAGTLVLKKESVGKCSLTVYGMMTPDAYDPEVINDNDYRSVKVLQETFGTVDNHSECGNKLMDFPLSYNNAAADEENKTPVKRAGKAENRESNTAFRVFVPDDSGTKATDIYVLYTEWSASSMPGPEERVVPQDPYDPQPDIVFTDIDTDCCEVSIVAGYNKGVVYDPALSIPSGRNVKLKAKGKQYLYDIKLVNVTGMAEISVTVRYPYAFYESAAAARKGEVPKDSGYTERTVTIMRPYGFWYIERFAVWKINEAGAFCNALTEGGTGYKRIKASPSESGLPDFWAVRYGSLEDRFVGYPSGGSLVVTVDELYKDIYRNGVAPEIPNLDEGYAERIAYEAIPEIVALNDVPVFNGMPILGEHLPGSPGVSPSSMTPVSLASGPKSAEIITFFSEEREIPTEKKNGTYPVRAAIVSYSLMPGSIGINDETRYRSVELPAPVVVQTPVYVMGSLFMGENEKDNLRYVQRENADIAQIWAVLGEERSYEGYDGSAPAETFCTCDLYAVLTNTADGSHPHLEYPGYGVRTFDEDIYKPKGDGLPYNRISFDIRVVIDKSPGTGPASWNPDFTENSADIVIEAGEWISIPADTPIRFIVPRDTPEGRHSITFASVASNKEDPENTLQTAMEIANTYCLSHAVYDRKFFNVVGRLWGLRMDVPGQSPASSTVGVGKKSAAGLMLSEPPERFFPAGEEEGVVPGTEAHFTIISTGLRANSETLAGLRTIVPNGRGLKITPTFLFAPVDPVTGKCNRNEAVEVELWYDPGPFTGRTGLDRFIPEITYDVPLTGTEAGEEEKYGFGLFIPSSLRLARKGSMDNLPPGIGLTANSEKWLINGALIVNFTIEQIYRIAGEPVKTGYDCGPADMWMLEGYDISAGYRKGDVLLVDHSAEIRDRFFVDHLN